MVPSSPCLIDNKELIVQSKRLWKSDKCTIDGHSLTTSEGSLRRHLKLDDQDGAYSLMRFLLHNYLHCLSPKKIAWEQFSSNIATALICLATNRKYNFSRMIFGYVLISLVPYVFDVPRAPRDYQDKRMIYSRYYATCPETFAFTFKIHSSLPTHEHTFPAHSLTPEHILAEHHFPTPDHFHVVHSHGSDEGRLQLNELMNLVTKLSDRIGALEVDLKKTKKNLQFSNILKTHSQGSRRSRRKFSEEELKKDVKRKCEVSTAGAKKGTASEEAPIVSTAEVRAQEELDKELEQERLSFAEAIRLEEQINEEQRAQIARDEEIARQWEEEERQRAMDEAKSTKKIDWNDPSVIRYHTLKMKPKTVAQARNNMIKYLKNQGNYKISDFKGMSYNDIRPIFEKVWDFNQNIEPMDAEHGSEKQKSPKKEKSPEKIMEEEVDTQEEMKEVVKEPGAKRKKSIPRKSTRKRQKMEEDAEKEELKGFLDIIPR
ncbi:hypothetical protein Tco_0347902 [Tanacetum coccineum]